jgi:hypothetical protein
VVVRNKSILEKPVGGTSADIADAIAKKHVRQHAITSTSDHTSTATLGKMLKADASGLPIDASNTDTEVASAVTLKHAVGDSIASSISDGDLTHSPDGNSVFDALALKAPLDSPIFTTKITTPIILAPGATLVLNPTIDSTTAIQLSDKDGNAILTVDTTNDRVGIGTANPQARLEIVGDGATLVMRAPTANQYGNFRIYNDQNVAVRALEMGYTGTTYGGFGGLTGEFAYLIPSGGGVYPLALGYNGSALTMILKNGRVGIGTTGPTAVLHLKAGTATASTAPLKLTSGTVNTTPEAGAIEFDGTDLFITI